MSLKELVQAGMVGSLPSQNRIAIESQKIMDANPGLTRKSSIELLRHQKPALFQGETPSDLAKMDVVKKAQQAINDAIDLREKEPHLTFAMAWAKLTRTNPELFAEFTEGED
jgi:hypothetical protein